MVWAVGLRELLYGGAAALLACAMPADAAPSYTGFYSFGDSLVDSGNAVDLAKFVDALPPPFPSVDNPAPPNLGYYESRFTNGYNFADRLSIAVTGSAPETVFPYGYPLPGGIPFPIPRPDGSAVNFAYGGAQVVGGDEFVPDASEQVAAYAALPGAADPGALYILTFGGNDIRQLVPSDGDPIVGEAAAVALMAAAQELLAQVGFLYSIGAQNVIVTGVPDVGLIPRYDDEARSALASAYSLQFDTLVRAALADLMETLGDQLLYFSLLDLSREIARDPLTFGFTNTTSFCLAERTPSPNIDCSGFLFFDDVHPTAFAHELVAQAILRRLGFVAAVPEPATVGLFGLALLGLGLARRRHT